MEIKKYYPVLKIFLFIVFLSLFSATPGLSTLVIIILPVPIVYLLLEYGNRMVLLVIILAAFINTLMVGAVNGFSVGIVFGLYTIVGFGMIGFVFASALKEKVSPLKIIVLVIVMVLVSNLLILYTLGSTFALSIDSYDEAIRSLVTESIGSLGIQGEQEAGILVNYYIEIIKKIIPASFIISSIVLGICTYYLTLWYLKSKDKKVESYKPLRLWKFPRWLIAAGLIISLLFRSNVYCLNALLVLSFLVFIQGFSVGLDYISRAKSIFTYILYIFLVLFSSPFSVPILFLAGFVDMWFLDLRKFKHKLP